MQLLPDRPSQALLGSQRTFRTSPWPPGLALFWMLVFAGFFARLVGPVARGIPWFVWIVAGPMSVVVGGALVLMASLFVFACLKCFRDTNWILTVARDGLYLNLRSYLNSDGPAVDPTVVFIPFTEIDSAQEVRESWRQRRLNESETRIRSYLELSVTRTDTAPLAQAISRESTRTPPEHTFLGVRTRTKSNDVPVFVPSPGTIRVQWKRGMLAALEEHVRALEARKDDISDALSAATTEERCLALLRRGEKIAAVESARSGYGVDFAEARRRVERLEQRTV